QGAGLGLEQGDGAIRAARFRGDARPGIAERARGGLPRSLGRLSLINIMASVSFSSAQQAVTGHAGTPSERWQMKDGRSVILRAAQPDDADAMQALVRSLSPRTRYLRFFNPLRELPPKLLDSFTHTDAHHAMTLLAFLD